MRATRPALGTAVAAALAVLLPLSALAFGTVHLWAGALLQIAVALLALLWYAERRLRPHDAAKATPRSFLAAALALVGYLALQLVPLPPALLAAVSPTAAEIHERTHAVLAEVRVPALPIRPVRSAADEAVSVEERERIRGFARDVLERTRGDARPIALDPFQSRFELLRYVAYGLALWLAATLPRPRVLLGGVAGAGAFVALLGIVEMATWNGKLLWFFVPYDAPGPMPNQPRMLGPFVNPDHFSAFVAFAFGPMLSLLAAPVRADPRRRRRRRAEGAADPLRIALVLLGLAVLAAAILGSGSRGGIFGALLSSIVVWTGRNRLAAPAGGWRVVRGRERKNRVARLRLVLDRALPATLALLVLVAGISYVGPGGRQMLDERLARTVYGSDLEVRMRFWSQTLPALPDFALVGAGLGGWNEVIQRYQRYPNVWYRQNHAHNDYLEWAVEVGLVGVALTLALAAAWALWAARNAAIPALVRAGLLGSIAAAAWHEIFDFVLRVPANALLLAVILGLLCNRRWAAAPDEAAVPDDGSIVVDERAARASRFGRAKVALAAALVLAVVVQGASDVREFLDWKRAREGSAAVARAPRSAATWTEIANLLSRAGLRHHPPAAEASLAAASLSPAAEEAAYRLSRALPYAADRRKALAAALALDPTRSAWRLAHAAELERAGLGEEALREVERAVRLDPVLARHPYATAAERKVAPAVVAAVERGFRAALADHGEVPAILADLARLLDHEGRPAEAADFWTRAAKASDEWASFGSLAGQALAKAGKLAEAEAALRRAIAEAPAHPHAYRVLALDVLREQGGIEEARAVLESGARRSARRSELYLALFTLHRDRGEENEALAALARAADAARGNASLRYQLGAAYFRAKDYHRSRAALARAIHLDPSIAASHYLLGAAEERLHELGAARHAYRQAVELDPENAGYRAALGRLDEAFADAARERDGATRKSTSSDRSSPR